MEGNRPGNQARYPKRSLADGLMNRPPDHPPQNHQDKPAGCQPDSLGHSPANCGRDSLRDNLGGYPRGYPGGDPWTVEGTAEGSGFGPRHEVLALFGQENMVVFPSGGE